MENTITTIDSGVGAVGPLAEDVRPYRAPRLGSGVLCSATIEGSGKSAILCESPLTTRLRGGKDSMSRPIAEMLCETCGAVFVSITVSLDPRVAFDQVAIDDEDFDAKPAIPVATALRRAERMVGAPVSEVLRQKMARLEVCTECGNIVRTDNGEWDAHALAHRED